MIKFCLFFSVLISVFFYYNFDPIKCSFFLVLSLVFVSPVLCCGVYNWCGYYVCLVFLSGVFVILVYFSSLSDFSYFNKSMSFLFFISVFFVGKVLFFGDGYIISMGELYYDFYLWLMFYIVVTLFFFFVFC